MGARVRPQEPHVGRVMQQVAKLVATPAGGWFFVHVASRVDRALIPLTRGRIQTGMVVRSVLLTHTGARSGVQRRTPLLYFTEGENVILVASNGGSTRNPAWYHNVTAHPEVELSDGANTGRYRAREAQGEERERLWQVALGIYPGWQTYQARTGGRRIPVLVLSPGG